MDKNKVLIIAEAGVNHNGSVDVAKKMIDCAFNAGADFVKFQTFRAKDLVTKYAEQAEYQIRNQGDLQNQYEMLKKLEINEKNHKILIEHSKKKGIQFLSTPFDNKSLKLLIDLGMDIIKIPSGEITNLPFLRAIGKCNKTVIMSTGMSTLIEIKAALDILEEYGTPRANITVLHCNTEYPTPIEDVNLRAMQEIKMECEVNVGYSDHTLGIEVPIAACAMGATVIEKHFTLDRNQKGPDHLASLEPKELKRMVHKIRNIQKAMGNGIKTVSKSELKNIKIARKSIVAKRDIQKGELFSDENITTKRPGTGMSPMLWDNIIGKVAQENFCEDDLIIISE